MTIFYQTGQETHVTRGDLPHWTQYGKMHFVTFRLADFLPQEKLKQLKNQRQEWLSRNQEPYTEDQWREYNRLFTERIEQWLDAGHGACLLSQRQHADIVAQAIRYFDRQRYFLDHWVVMPNHVHVLLVPMKPHTLKEILHSWKSFTSSQINKIRGHSGELWQHESFDHIVRSKIQLEKFRKYIIENWEKSGKVALISTQEIDLTEWPKHLASE
jgi:REP element-mobilizing transposase RayT